MYQISAYVSNEFRDAVIEFVISLLCWAVLVHLLPRRVSQRRAGPGRRLECAEGCLVFVNEAQLEWKCVINWG